MILAVDASVALKWFLDVRDTEPDSERVVALLSGIGDGSVQIVQPVCSTRYITPSHCRSRTRSL